MSPQRTQLAYAPERVYGNDNGNSNSNSSELPDSSVVSVKLKLRLKPTENNERAPGTEAEMGEDSPAPTDVAMKEDGD